MLSDEASSLCLIHRKLLFTHLRRIFSLFKNKTTKYVENTRCDLPFLNLTRNETHLTNLRKIIFRKGKLEALLKTDRTEITYIFQRLQPTVEKNRTDLLVNLIY